MGKYIKLFEEHVDYMAYISSQDAILPNVSACIDANDVHYNPEPYGGHEYVEIGGLKWATMNLGANSVTDTGLYFQWGDTQGYTAAQIGSGEGQKYFGWEDYKYATNPQEYNPDMTKYNATDGKTVLDADDDAVKAAWGGAWRMPTKAEFESLISATTIERVTDYLGSGVNGGLFTDITDSTKKIFIPYCGRTYNGELIDLNASVCWSKTLRSDIVTNAYQFFFDSLGDEYSGPGIVQESRNASGNIRPIAD